MDEKKIDKMIKELAAKRLARAKKTRAKYADEIEALKAEEAVKAPKEDRPLSRAEQSKKDYENYLFNASREDLSDEEKDEKELIMRKFRVDRINKTLKE